MFDSQAEMLKEDVPTAAVGTYFEFYSTASDFAVVASKGIPNESQSKIPEGGVPGWCHSCALVDRFPGTVTGDPRIHTNTECWSILERNPE